MKIAFAVVAVIAILLLFWKRGQSPKPRIEGPVSSWTIPEEWKLSSGELDGKVIITRFNHGLRVVAGNPLFQKEIGIAVPFNHPREDGLPRSEEHAPLSDLEDEIRRRLSADNTSLFTGVITTGGMREFVFYTSNEEAAVAKVQSLVQETKNYQLQYVINDDPEWSVFKNFAPE